MEKKALGDIIDNKLVLNYNHESEPKMQHQEVQNDVKRKALDDM